MMKETSALFGGGLRAFLQMMGSKQSLLAWLALIIGLTITMLAATIVQRQQTFAIELKFEQRVQDVVNAVSQRLQQHEQILLGGAGLFAASEQVDRSSWQHYIAHLQLEKNYPGILGVGFSQLVKPEQLQQHQALIRAQGFSDYRIFPAGERERYTTIIYLEPFSGRNLAAFGYDMYSEPTRQVAMTKAAATGQPAISGKVRLVQETHGREQAGFLMYVPVYANGQAVDNADLRWQALEGFVYSPYRIDDLMQGILGANEQLVDFKIYDGQEMSIDTLMYDSTNYYPSNTTIGDLQAIQHISVYGHRWTLFLNPKLSLINQFSSSLPWFVLVFGMVSSFLLFLLIVVLLYRRDNALVLADEMVRLKDASEMRFHQLFLSVGQGVIIYDVNGIIVDANPAAESLFGLAINNMRGVHCLDPCWRTSSEQGVLLTDELNPVMIALRDATAVKETLIQIWHQATDKWRWLQMSVYPSRLGDTKSHVYFYATVSDMTLRRKNERHIQEQAKYTQAILDTVLDGIVTIDKQGVMQTVNPAMTSIFGYTTEQLLGKNVRMLMAEPDRSAHSSYIDNYLQTHTSKVLGIGRELKGLHQNGHLFEMELQVAEISWDAQTHFVGMVRDISQRKKIERLKGEFVSNVSHELRTPLTAVCGALDLVASGKLGTLNAATEKLIRLAQSNSQRLKFLINDLLDFEKLSQGKLEFDIQLQALRPLLQQAVDSHQTYSLEKHITVLLNAQSPDIEVKVDGQRFEQVMANLLSNAIKFSPANSTVMVIVQLQGAHVRVTVKDQGTGIPDDFKPRIFQRFSQADGSDTRNTSGTGLGLAICRELIERMNGRIGFDSEAGEGASFWFELPLATEKDKR